MHCMVAWNLRLLARAGWSRPRPEPRRPPTSRFTFYVQLFTTTLPFPNFPNTHTHTHTRTHITVLLMEEPVRWAHCFCHPLKSEGSTARFELCPGVSGRQVAVIGPGRRSKSQSDRWAWRPQVHTTPRRRPPPFLGTRRSCCCPALQIALFSCSASPVSLAGGTASQLPACLAPIPSPIHVPSCPMSQFAPCSGGSFPVSPPRSGRHPLRVPAVVQCPRTPEQPLKSLAAHCPRLLSNQTHPIPLCYLCRGLDSVTRCCHILVPAEAPGRCVMEVFGLGRPAANTDVTLCCRSLGRFLQRLAHWILPNAARLQVLHNILSV